MSLVDDIHTQFNEDFPNDWVSIATIALFDLDFSPLILKIKVIN